ncbi:iron transporter [Polaromonas sp.]|uniref:iron transporter n=1 Tax=Polaromonas sp. TaxID=1869339 RepID=UPI0025E4B594|nr:iron transporter [Polaromonas sp.]
MKKSFPFLLAGLAAALAFANAAHGAEPKVKVLTPAEDATQKTVLIGRALGNNMTIVFEIEPAKAMWMPMGKSGQWMEHAPGPNERFHVEVKPVDPASNTRIPYANVKFAATNKDNGKKVQAQLHPMWGGSGLHYTVNSALAGDGVYEARITVGVPTFARDMKSKELWSKPTTANFHFKLAGGKLIEVTEPAEEMPVKK